MRRKQRKTLKEWFNLVNFSEFSCAKKIPHDSGVLGKFHIDEQKKGKLIRKFYQMFILDQFLACLAFFVREQ